MDRYRDTYGVEPICTVLQVAPSAYWRHAARLRHPALRSARAQRDDVLRPDIPRIGAENLQVYGADKVRRQIHREGVAVARCTVERLMKHLGLQGVRRGKRVRTTVHGARSRGAVPSGPREPPVPGQPPQPAVGYRTSPMSRPGRASCMSPLSSTSLPGASSVGG